MIALIYVRSREEEKRKSQEEKCKKYADEKGIEVVGVFDDWEDVLLFATINGADTLIVSHRSRLSRNHIEFFNMRNSLNNININLICVNENE